MDRLEWLKDLFDHAHDLIQIVDINGSIKYVNKAWSDSLGYSQSEIIKTSIYHFIDEPDRVRYREYRDQVIRQQISGKPISINLVAKNGRKIALQGVVSVKIENGVPQYTRGIFHDISVRIAHEKELEQLNEELLEREYNLQQLLTYAPDAIIVIDTNSRITYWNPKAEAIFGWQSEEVVGRSLTETIIPPKHVPAHESGMRRYLQTGEKHVLNRTIEITALKKSGEEFYISLTISQTTQKGKIAFVAFIRDITEQKKAALDIENKTRQLELSNKSLEAFAYAASHDLKQPARKIQIFTEQLARSATDKLNDNEKGYILKIDKAVVRMRDLVEDLLTYSSLSAGANLAQAVDLNHIVTDVAEDLEIEIRERSATITFDSLPVIHGTRRQLHQLFHNLIGNAVKYSKPAGSNKIHITATLVNGGRSGFQLPEIQHNQLFHLIEVSDNGIGFDQEHAEKIFQIFTRLHNQQEYQGSGVGLSIVLKVVENHQGYVKAEGKPGQGATFRILLPVAKQ